MSGYTEVITNVETGKTEIRQFTSEEVLALQERYKASAIEDRTKMRLSFAQLLIGLVSEKWITVEEGRAWRDRYSLPLQVQAVIFRLPVEQQFAAETRALTPSEVLRLDPLVIAMGASIGKTEEEMDSFFLKYSGI